MSPPAVGPAGSSRFRTIALGAGISLAATFLTLAALEAGVRLLGAGPGDTPFRRVDIFTGSAFRPAAIWGTGPLKRQSPFGVWAGEYQPGLRFRFVYPDNRRGNFDAANAVESRINRFGMRGPEIEQAKRPGTFRIMGLGDSYTFGEGVREEETFLARIGAALNGGSSGPRVETINTGVSSYNTMDEITYLERRWVGFEPDLVLVTFVLNDAYEESIFGPLQQGYTAGMIRLARERSIAGSRLLALVYDRWLRWSTGRRTARVYQSQFSTTPLIPGNNWESCRTALARAESLARGRGFRLALAIFPELYRLDDGYPFRSVHELVKRDVEQLGIPVLDLFEAFRGRDARTLWAHPADHHPNEEAHRIAAEALLAFLRDPRRNLLPPPLQVPAQR